MGRKILDMIEINGRLYGASDSLKSRAVPTTQPGLASDITAPISKVSRTATSHAVASNTRGHASEPSKVLNRRSVKKPTISQKPAIKLSRPAEPSYLIKKPSSNLIRLSTAKINPIREDRAHKIPKSSSVKRFNPIKTLAESIANPKAATARKSPLIKTGRTFDIMPNNRPALATAASAPTTSLAAPASKFTELVQSEKIKRHRYLEYKSVRMHHGLAGLGSGQRRALAFATIGLAIVLITGFVFYEQRTNIELQLANSRAGINANLPSYRPAGFSIGKFSYQPGLVAVNYYSSSDGHFYNLVQKSSSMDSQALADQLAATGNYKALHNAGQTIFTSISSNASKAAWVSGGILYEINGNASLSQSQIIKIANET